MSKRQKTGVGLVLGVLGVLAWAIVGALSWSTHAVAATWAGGNPTIGGGNSSANAWAAAVEAQMKALVPAVTQCTYVKLGTDGIGALTGASCKAGAIEGGSVTVFKSGTSGVCPLVGSGNTTLFQNPTSAPFTFALHGKIPSVATSNIADVSMATVGGATQSVIGVDKGAGGVNSPNWAYSVPGSESASSFVADTSLHNFIWASTGTTVSFLVDANVLGTKAASALTSAIGPAMVTTQTTGTDALEYDYCYVAPTSLIIDNAGPALASTWRGFGADSFGLVETAVATAAGQTTTTRAYHYQMLANSGARVLASIWPIEAYCTNWPTTSCTYNFASADEVALETWIGKVGALGIIVALKGGWWYPDNICAVSGNGCTPTAGQLTAFGHALSDETGHLLNTVGLSNFEEIRFFTEANNDTDGSNIPAGFTKFTYYPHVVQTVTGQMATDDASRTPVLPRLAITGTSDTTFPSWGRSGDTLLVPTAIAAQSTFTGWTSHAYGLSMSFPPRGQVWSNSPAGATQNTEFIVRTSIISQWINTDSLGGGAGPPKPFVEDEMNVDPGSDPDVIRESGWAGLENGRHMLSAVAGGASGADPWTISDEMAFPTPLAGAVQQFGFAPWTATSLNPRQSWFMYAMQANLMPSGKSLRVYGNDNYLNAAAVQSTGGDVTVTIANAGPTPLPVAWSFTAQPSKNTLCRYVFNGNAPVRPTPGNPYHRIPWDKTFSATGVADTIPAKSIAAYSTICTYAPPTTDVLLGTTATATSNGAAGPYVVNDGDKSQATGVGWTPGAGQSGTVTIPVSGGSATINHCRLTFPCTDEPMMYADGATMAHPSVQSTFTLQYKTGGAATDFSPSVNESANGQCVRDYSFAPVTASSVIYGAPIGASAVNEIACDNLTGVDTVLGFYGYTNPSVTDGTNRDAETISTTSHVIASGDNVELDVWLADNVAAIGGIDVTISGGTCGTTELSTLGAGTWHDQNGIGGAPTADLSGHAYGVWYHRVLAFPSCAVGATVTKWELATNNTDHLCSNRATPPCSPATTWGAGRTAFYDNITVTNGGSMVMTIYADGAPATVANVHAVGYLNADVFMQPKTLS